MKNKLVYNQIKLLQLVKITDLLNTVNNISLNSGTNTYIQESCLSFVKEIYKDLFKSKHKQEEKL